MSREVSEHYTTPESRSARRFFFARDDDGPVITAAGNPNSTELETILLRAAWLSPRDRSELALNWVHDEASPHVYWDTPLLRAINRQVYNNIELLLRHGALPDGVPRRFQESYSRRFRRIRFRVPSPAFDIPVHLKDVASHQTQTFPLMEVELLARKSIISRFWADASTMPLNIVGNGDKLHSLVMAGGTTPAIFKLLLDSGADATFWTGTVTPSELPADESLVPSALCLSTPIHTAISAGNMSMLEFLLDSGFNPNAQALMAGCQAFTPMQHAVLTNNLDALRAIQVYSSADVNLRTPVYGIHILHLAVAQLRPELLEVLTALGVTGAPVTTLRHNLAHVACMPLNNIDIQLFAPKVRQSIHDIRSLEPLWQPDHKFQRAAERHHLHKAPRAPTPTLDDALPLKERRFSWFELPSTLHFDAQTTIAKRLVADHGVRIFCQSDYCGNTALHYLASARIVNDGLVVWLRGFQEADSTWKEGRNAWFHTPHDLWVDNVTVLEVGYESVFPRLRYVGED